MSKPTNFQEIENIIAQDSGRVHIGDTSIERLHNHFHGSSQEPAAALFAKYRRIIYSSDPYVDRANLIEAKGKRATGTCEWVKATSTYKAWLDDEPGLLWINGSPGKGKTMITIFLTEDLEKTEQVIYYFCRHDSALSNTATAVLRGLIWQITGMIPPLTKHLEQYLDLKKDSVRNQHVLASAEVLWVIFTTLLQDPELVNTIHCLLDGLDECEEDSKRWLVDKFAVLFASDQPPRLRMVVSSRYIFALDSYSQIKLDPDNDMSIGQDIETMVSVGLQELSRTIPRLNEIRDVLYTQLLARAQGTFLWLGFAMTELKNSSNTTRAMEIMNNLPHGLEPFYARMIHRIDPADRPASTRILRWVTIAKRPLTPHDIEELLYIHIPDMKSRERTTRDSLEVCKPLLVMDKDQQLHMVHASASEYFLRKGIDNDEILETFRFEREEAHLDLAKACFDQALKTSRYHSYGTDSWNFHLRCAGSIAGPLFESKSEIFGEPSDVRDKCWKKIDHIFYDLGDQPPLFTACGYDLPVWAHGILAENWWKFDYRRLYTQIYHGETALITACRHGQLTVARALVLQGANVNATDRSGATPLMLSLGHESNADGAMTEFLLCEGANVDSLGRTGFTAVHIAVKLRAKPSLQSLCGHGAGFDMDEKYWSIAFARAIGCEDEDIELLLLEQALKSGICQRHALKLALSATNHNIVRIILQNGVDIEERDSEGLTALLQAVRNRYPAWDRQLKFVTMLLDYGARVNSRDPKGLTALHMAAGRGGPGVINVLLNCGLDVNSVGCDGRTALHIACMKLRVRVVSSLLSNDATVNMKMDRGATALHLLVWALDRIPGPMNRVNISDDDDSRDWPLSRSGAYRYGETLADSEMDDAGLITRLLLLCGADLGITDDSGQTVVEVARAKRMTWLVSMLEKHTMRVTTRRSQSARRAVQDCEDSMLSGQVMSRRRSI